MYAYPVHSADEPTYSEDELFKMAASASSLNVEDVKNAFALIQEATVFFNILSCENALPSTPNKIIKRFEAKLDPPEFIVKYPVNVIIEIELNDPAAGFQQYTMEKLALNKAWEVHSAFQLSAEKKKVAVLKLPSQSNQKKANDKVPESIKEWNDQK